MAVKEKIIRALDNLSEDQQKKLLEWVESLQKEKVKPPAGKLGLQKPFRREEFYDNVLSDRF